MKRLMTLLACLAVVVVGITPTAVASVTRATTDPPGTQITTPACGDVLFPTSASGTWVIPGGGVPVYSNGPWYPGGPNYEGTGSDCSTKTSAVNGITAGEEWQCVEFVNRLYLTRGWISYQWVGDAGEPFWQHTPSDLTKQPNRLVSYLGPGDVVIIEINNDPDDGHALVVNDTSDVTSGTVNLVSQNSGLGDRSEPVVTGTLSDGSVTVSGGGKGFAYKTIGVVHAPTWTPFQVPVPTVTGTYGLVSVSCPAAGWCVAVGGTGYPTSAGPGLIETLSDDKWTVTAAPLPVGAAAHPGGGLDSVACIAAGSCVAVGVYESAAGVTLGWIETLRSGHWSATEAPIPPAGNGQPIRLTSVACSRAATCVAVGQFFGPKGSIYALIETRLKDKWTGSAAPEPGNAAFSLTPDAQLFAVSCAATAYCVAVGNYASGTPAFPGLIETLSNGIWHPTEAPSPAGLDSPLQLTSVSCSTQGSCAAVGSYSDSHGDDLIALEALSQGRWVGGEAPLPAGAEVAAQNWPAESPGVSCAAPGSCVAVGTVTDRGWRGLIEVLSRGKWLPSLAPPPPGANGAFQILQAVDCMAINSCVAVGFYRFGQGTSAANGLVETMAAGTWTAEAPPLLPESGLNGLDRVACWAASFCVAVDYSPVLYESFAAS